MSTFGVLIDRIEDEIRDTGIRSNVQDAIRTAIKQVEYQRFWFNEERGLLFTTSSSQEYYSTLASPPAGVDLPNLLIIDSVRINTSGVMEPIRRSTWNEIEYLNSLNTTTGVPNRYVYYDQQFRLSPRPNASLTVEISAVVKFATLSATTDTNAWMTDGELLIRNLAKAHIYAHVKGDDSQAQKHLALAEAEQQRLKTETVKRLQTGRVTSWSF